MMSKYKRCNMKCGECDDPCDKGSVHYFLMLNVVSRLGIEVVHEKPQWWKEHGAIARSADRYAERRSYDYLEYGDGDEAEDDEDMREFDKIYDSEEDTEDIVKIPLLVRVILILMYVSIIVVMGIELS